jgi:hypothetical protein
MQSNKINNQFNIKTMWSKVKDVTSYIFESPKIIVKNTYNFIFNPIKYKEDKSTQISFSKDMFFWMRNKSQYLKDLEYLNNLQALA